MPRAAFSQIVNRSMSEVLTRSLATSFTTLLGVLSLLIFGGVTLQDFAFAMGVGILSGTYSSIFIASPVLTAWKEREPGFARRRERIAQLDGTVPAFADDIELAKLAEDDGEGEIDGVDAAAEPEARPPAAAVATAEPGEGVEDGGPGASANGEKAAAEKASAERRRRNAERRERRQQRRKHGRNR
jgi:SecD/SecF fusion protein